MHSIFVGTPDPPRYAVLACNAGSRVIYSPTRMDAGCDIPVLVKYEGPGPAGGSYPALLTSLKVGGRAVAVCMCACWSGSAACVSI